MLHYDSANDVVVLINFTKDRQTRQFRRTGGVFIYWPEKNEWTGATGKFPKRWTWHPCGHGFYGPVLNAHFVFTAGDSRKNGIMFVYRYRRRPGEQSLRL